MGALAAVLHHRPQASPVATLPDEHQPDWWRDERKQSRIRRLLAGVEQDLLVRGFGVYTPKSDRVMYLLMG